MVHLKICHFPCFALPDQSRLRAALAYWSVFLAACGKFLQAHLALAPWPRHSALGNCASRLAWLRSHSAALKLSFSILQLISVRYQEAATDSEWSDCH